MSGSAYLNSFPDLAPAAATTARGVMERWLATLVISLWATLLLQLISIDAVVCVSATNMMGTYPALFVFGDSLSDTGNAFLSGSSSARRTVQMPYGETFPGWPAGRYSDGHLLVDLLADHLGLPWLNPYLNSSADFSRGVNYAVAGATALNTSVLHSFGLKPVTNLSLDVQLSWHLELQAKVEQSLNGIVAGSPTNVAFAEGLYVIEIGGNDYINAFLANYPPSFVISTLIPLVIQQIHTTIESLLNNGAKHFLLVSITPLGCSPSILSLLDGAKDANDCLQEYNIASYIHGAHVQEEVATLRVSNPDASFLFMDFYGAYDYVLNHSEMFGFSEILKTCCGAGDEYAYNYNAVDLCNKESVNVCDKPTEYIVWDGAHYTDSLNLQIFNQTFITGSYLDIPFTLSYNH